MPFITTKTVFYQQKHDGGPDSPPGNLRSLLPTS